MKANITLSSTLVVLLFAYFVNCQISTSSETAESLEISEEVKMPEKQWADYKVSID